MSGPFLLTPHPYSDGTEYAVHVYCLPLQADPGIYDNGEDDYLAWGPTPDVALARAVESIDNGSAEAHFREVAQRYGAEHLLAPYLTTEAAP